MTDIINTTVEILGKHYPVRCPESEVDSLLRAAAFLNEKMMEIQEQAKSAGVERVAVIAALNIAHQFQQLEQQNNGMIDKIHSKINNLQEKLDTAIHRTLQTEMIYITE